MAVVVLVHGAWHGAWCWERVVAGLSDRGTSAVALDLPGHGADADPMGDLHDDAARVRDVLDGLDEPVVLVGHSYGGAVITEAGEHPVVDRLVFIAAFALDVGESCMAAAVEASAEAGTSWEGRPNLGEAFVVGEDGRGTLEPEVAADCLYNDCDDQTVAWALRHLGPHPLANLEQTPAAAAWRSKSSTYVVCTEDLAVHPDLQRLMARRCQERIDWPTGHSPFLSRPGLVTGLLADLSGPDRRPR
ncbi:MAG TPA: alpha/beta hydrolase [Acidimicrobiales bacterium]|nr:alpha/beta hydrolase [Acidimicrobiales bacterium]